MIAIFIAGEDTAVTPSKILAFVTGAEQPPPPPMGFLGQPSIRFIEDRNQTLPTASTCALCLYLPLSLGDLNYPAFKERMDFAILSIIGFGQV